MIYVNLILYYTFFASSVLIYGIGINRIGEIGIVKFPNLMQLIKMFLGIMISASITWVVTFKLLIPLNLIELYPFFLFLILLAISSFLECIVRFTSDNISTEFLISFLIILLSISESTSFIQTILICLSSLLSIIIIIPFIITFRFRMENNGLKLTEKYYSVLFFFLGFMILVFTVFDSTWFALGV